MNNKYIEIKDKNGCLYVDALEHLNGNDITVVANFLVDDKYTSITKYLLANKVKQVVMGIVALVSATKATSVRIYLDVELDSKELKNQIEMQKLSEITTYYLKSSSLINREVSFLETGIEENSLLVVDAETACQLESGKQSKWIEVHTPRELNWIEVTIGTTISDVLKQLGIEPGGPILLGGSLGEFLFEEQLKNRKVEYSYLYDSIYVFDSSNCMCDESKELFTHIWKESCGKCVLCREGTYQLKTIFTDITEGKSKKEDIELMNDICELIQIGALCSYGRNMARLALTAINVNQEEFDAHIKKKQCPAGVCKSFANYVIVPKDCTGCGDCIDSCEEDAIEGKPGFIHMIDEDLCVKCGKCVDACEEGAIIIPTSKVKVPKRLTKVGRFK